MKRKLPSYAMQNFKSASKRNGIYAFLIILSMTFSSYAQENGIEFKFNCNGDFITVKFDSPDVSGTNYVYPEGTAFDDMDEEIQMNWFVVYVQSSSEWELKGPTTADGSGTPSTFYVSSSTTSFPSNTLGDWSRTTAPFPCSLTSITYTEPSGDPDADGDGYNASVDCNDEDANVNPDATEICDGIDNDCDGQIDEDFEDCTPPDIIEYCNEAETKILMCHNGKDICVSINAVDAHIGHGDTYGPCANTMAENQEGAEDILDTIQSNPTTIDVVFWPNPSNDVFNVKMATPNFEDTVNLQVFDINGRLVHSNVIGANKNYKFGNSLSNGIYFAKLSQAGTSTVLKVVKH